MESSSNDNFRLTENFLIPLGYRPACGCVPCVGQCTSEEVLSIFWCEKMEAVYAKASVRSGQ